MSLADNVVTVLERMIQMVEDNPDWADEFAKPLDSLLDAIAENDGFGTERQVDPRGDGREGEFDIWSLG